MKFTKEEQTLLINLLVKEHERVGLRVFQMTSAAKDDLLKQEIQEKGSQRLEIIHSSYCKVLKESIVQ